MPTKGDHFKAPEPGASSAGPGVDARGTPVVDPTKNVLDKVTDAVARLDDLREIQTYYTEKIADMRAGHYKELREAETGRLDAIRLVDTGNVERARAEAEQRANTLAGQVTSAADAVRVTLEAARIQTADTLQAVVDPIKVDIADLRRVQYQQAGERVAQTEVTPQQTILNELLRLQHEQAGKKELQTETKGTSQWMIGLVVIVVLGIVGFFITLIVAASSFYLISHNKSSTTTPPAVSCSVALVGEACVK